MRCASRICHVPTQHVETYDEENMRDFVDVYLKEIGSSKDPSFNGNSNLKKKDFKEIILSEEQLLVNAMDLFSAGSETTATTLAWAVRGMLLTFFVICASLWTP